MMGERLWLLALSVTRWQTACETSAKKIRGKESKRRMGRQALILDNALEMIPHRPPISSQQWASLSPLAYRVRNVRQLTESVLILSGDAVKQYILHGGLKFEPELDADQFQQNGVDMVVSEVESEMLTAGGFTLGRTREIITMPNDLCAFVQLRSTWARKGFILPPTMIDAGFHGSITLEIAKFGASSHVPVGQRFAHVIFAKLTGPTDPYRGKYQGQVAITGAL
jgi:dCTP deaminase